MNSTVSFQNDGLIDMRAVTTFGVSAKEGENPIGFFGTGLKYAIAVILRHGGRVTIFRGLQRFNFTAETEQIRGQDFGIVKMQWADAAAAGHPEDEHTKLGFTTHVGARWEAWMAFRELYCNALDEPGADVAAMAIAPAADKTTVVVSGWAEFLDAYVDRDKIVLAAGMRPHTASRAVEFYDRPSGEVYVKRVRAMKMETPSRWMMNVVAPMELTEDRTVKNAYVVDHHVREAVLGCTDPSFIEDWLTSPEGSYENTLNLNCYAAPTAEFLDAAARLRHETRRAVNPSAMAVLAKHRASLEALTSEELSKTNAEMMEAAVALLARIGYPDPRLVYRVAYVRTLGANVYGVAYIKENALAIALHTFDRGVRFLAGTLLEEYLHLSMGLEDESRSMQNYLLDKLMAVTEELSQGCAAAAADPRCPF